MPGRLKPAARRLDLVCPYPFLDSISVLCDLVDALAERGFDVRIFTKVEPGFSTPTFASRRVSVHRTNWRPIRGVLRRRKPADDTRGGRSVRRITRLWRRVVSGIRWRAARVLGPARAQFDALPVLAWSIWLGVTNRRGQVRWIVGVDPAGLMEAAKLNRFVGAESAYYSLELLLSGEARLPSEIALKARERALSKQCAFVVIQDEARAKLLADDNDLPLSRFVLAPNASRGPARRAPSRYWHREFGLSSGTRVLLHTGSVYPWTGIESIVDAAAKIPDDWVLVIHTRDRPNESPEMLSSASYLEKLREMGSPSKVFFSVTPAPRLEYRNLLDGADLGIAFYVPTPGDIYTQENIRTIGLSSGKTSAYLWAGLPVIVNSATTLGSLVAAADVGISVDDASEIPSAVRRLADNYQPTSARAVEFFNAQLDFRHGLARILERIEGSAPVLPGGVAAIREGESRR